MRYLPKKNEDIYSHKDVYLCVYDSCTHNCQKLEKNNMSI